LGGEPAGSRGKPAGAHDRRGYLRADRAVAQGVADARAYAGTLRGKGYKDSEGDDVKTFALEAKVAAAVHAVGYSPNGRMLASGSADGVIGLLDAMSGATVAGGAANQSANKQ
jgi:hypothetical protein